MTPALLATAMAVVLLTGCQSSDTPTLTAPSTPPTSIASFLAPADTTSPVSSLVNRSGLTVQSTTTSVAATPPTSAHPAVTGSYRIGDNDNGTTISVVAGTSVVAVLDSLYWTFAAPSPPGILTPDGTPVYVSGGCTIPGEGCGTVTATYTAIGAGTATIAASRTSCGEALRCTGNLGSYSVKVTVTK